MEETWGRIILTPESTSSKFHDKVLVLNNAQTITVSRSSSDDKPDTENAVFDCRVLSKPQAVFIFQENKFHIKDLGSSNGTFINNFRLSKAGVESEFTQIYTDDVLRFGSEIETEEGNKSKSVICRIKIYSSDGSECKVRSIADRLYRPKSDFIANVTVKQVKFSDVKDERGENDALQKLEKMITEKFLKEQESLKDSISVLEKKLRRKQNENQNLIDNIEKLTKAELDRVSEIYDLKDALEIRDKECLKLSDELAVKTKEQIDNIKVKDLECELEDLKKVLKFTTDELWLLKEKLTVESTRTKRKKDIENNNVAQQGELEAKTLQIEKLNDSIKSQKEEIDQLNDLITKGDEIIQSKDKEIKSLKKALENDHMKMSITEGEYSSLRCLMTEENETVHQIQEEMSRLLKIIANDQEAMVDKDKTIDNLTTETETLKTNLQTVELKLQEKIKETNEAKEGQQKQEALVAMVESYKEKIKEAMAVIEEKSREIENVNKNVADYHANTKDSEILNLKQEIKAKDKLIQEKSQNEDFAINEINAQISELESELKIKEEMIKQLEIEVVNERQVATHVQFTQEKELMLKEKEISALNTILTQERKVLLEKEEEIMNMRQNIENNNEHKSVTRERATVPPQPTRPPRTRSLFITTNMQVDAGLVSNGTSSVNSVTMKETNDDNSDTVTFHDALNQSQAEDNATSDEEDVLIEDLELDEDADDRRPRMSDINFDQFSLC